MDMLNKLRSTVAGTVYTLSNVLPGNPVTREFEATKQVCSAGPDLLWKIYAGYKKSTKQEASIFVFEKKLLERWPRENRENVLESLRRGIVQLTKLRHPQILTVQHPLEESRDSLAFATEPVYASLSNVLGNHDNIQSVAETSLKDYKLFEIEKKYGLLQIGEGLSFLHNDVKLVHNNLCVESIVINQQGAWKIFGFDFCIHQEGPTSDWRSAEHSTYLPHVVQPSLDYLAPEAGLANKRSPASDMYSLGAVIYALHHDGKPPIPFYNDLQSFKSRICEIKVVAGSLKQIPDGLKDIVKMLLHFTPELRPDAHQFKKIGFFEDVGVKTLNYLDSLFQWDKLQKSQFYKGLGPIIQQFPHRVCVHRVVPCLVKEFANPNMVPFVLPVILQIAEKCTREEYMAHIFPHLTAIMTLTDPVQILLIFMQKMELLLKLTPAEEVKSAVLPMLYRALDSDAQQIQELCLSVLPTYATLIDYPAMKNALMPRIKKLSIGTSYLSVRVNCLVCVGKLLEHLDKWLVLDEILPFLTQITSREPAVLMAILGIYKIALTHRKLGIPKEVIATKCIPFLMPMTIENGLTLTQFNTLFSVLRDMVNRVESEHRVKIEQLSAIKQETNALNASAASLSSQPASELNSSSGKVDIDSIFSEIENKSGMSMKEKHRIVKQQEDAFKFGNREVPLEPKQAAIKNITPPKDLTSTLMQSNLATLVNSKSPIMGATVGSSFSSKDVSLSSHSFNWPATAVNNNFKNLSMSQQQSSSQMTGMMDQRNHLKSFNLSLSNNENSMMTPNKYTLPSSSGKSLSTAEINDFLS